MRNYRTYFWLAMAVLGGTLALVPFLPVSLPYFFYMLFWITMASSFNMIYGLVGYLPFGYVMFYGVGTYITAILYTRYQMPIPLAIVCSGLGGILLSLVFAPTLRLKGIYFAIVNFSCAMVLRIVVANLPTDFSGGSFGITLTGAYRPIAGYYAMLILVAVTILASFFLTHSRLGIALRCIRDDEAAAGIMGINVPVARLQAWMLASLFPSLAGGVEAWFTTIIDPDTSFNMMITAKTVVYAMFGGLGTVLGPVLGSIMMYALDDFIWSRLPVLNLMVIGAGIIFLILFLPRGVVGSLRNKWPGLGQVLA